MAHDVTGQAADGLILSYMTKYNAPLDHAFHALADPTRRAVLARLCDGPQAVTLLSQPFAMALPTFVQHLRVLEDSGLIASEKIGRTRICRINRPLFAQVEDWMSAQRRKWEAQTDRLQEFLEQGRDLADGPTPKGDER